MLIDEMPAGREMDCLIAEHIFNWGKDTPENVSRNHGYYRSKKLLQFSADIAAAWKMEEEINKMGKRAQVNYTIELQLMVGKWAFDLIHALPLHRCRAALKAMGVTEI